MNPRFRTSFTATMSAVAMVSSSVPLIGAGLGMYVSTIVWAVAGWRAFMLSLSLSAIVDFASTVQLASAASSTAPVVIHSLSGIVRTNLSLAYLFGFLGLATPLAMLFGLWSMKRAWKKLLKRRLGDRFPQP